MEQYYGFTTGTIIQMRLDLTSALNRVVRQNDEHPSDAFLYKRVQRMANQIAELTTELEYRFDEVIVETKVEPVEDELEVLAR